MRLRPASQDRYLDIDWLTVKYFGAFPGDKKSRAQHVFSVARVLATATGPQSGY